MRVEIYNDLRIYRTALALKQGRDDDLIAVLDAAPKGHLASTIREMMRSGVKAAFCPVESDDELDIQLNGAEFEI